MKTTRKLDATESLLKQLVREKKEKEKEKLSALDRVLRMRDEKEKEEKEKERRSILRSQAADIETRLRARKFEHNASRLFIGAELKNHEVFVCSDIYEQVEKLIEDAIFRMYEENNCDRSLLRELENMENLPEDMQSYYLNRYTGVVDTMRYTIQGEALMSSIHLSTIHSDVIAQFNL